MAQYDKILIISIPSLSEIFEKLKELRRLIRRW